MHSRKQLLQILFILLALALSTSLASSAARDANPNQFQRPIQIFKRDLSTVQSRVVSRITSGSTDVFSLDFNNKYQFRRTPHTYGNKAEFDGVVVESGALAKIKLYFDELDTETTARDNELIENILRRSEEEFVDSGVEHASSNDEYVKVFYIM